MEIKNRIEKAYNESGYKKFFGELEVYEIDEDDEKYIGYFLSEKEEQDLPIILIYKDGKEEIVNIPPDEKGDIRIVYSMDFDSNEKEIDDLDFDKD